MLDRQRGAVGGELEQRRVLVGELARALGADVQHADRAALVAQRHAQQRPDAGLAQERLERLDAGDRRDHRRLARRGDPSGEPLAERDAEALLDGLRVAVGRLDHQRVAGRVEQADRRALDLEDVGDLGEQLAQQVVERQVAQRDVGDRLELADRVGDRLGLGARRLLLEPLGALALGALALGDVEHLDDEVERLAVGVARERDRHEHVDRETRRRAGTGARPGRRSSSPASIFVHVLARLLAVARDEHAAEVLPDQVALRAADDVAERLVDLEPAAVGVDQADADRRVGERRAEALLGLREPRRLLVQVDEDRHLRPQHLGVERLEHVVDGADRVAAEDLLLLLVDRGQEDDRDVLGLRPLLDHLGGLEAVHVRHLDVEQDHREVVMQQPLERLLAGPRLDHVDRQRVEHRAQRQQVLRLVVDDQDVGLAPRAHRLRVLRALPHELDRAPARSRPIGEHAVGLDRPGAPRAASRTARPRRGSARSRSRPALDHRNPRAPSSLAPVSTTPTTRSR